MSGSRQHQMPADGTKDSRIKPALFNGRPSSGDSPEECPTWQMRCPTLRGTDHEGALEPMRGIYKAIGLLNHKTCYAQVSDPGNVYKFFVHFDTHHDQTGWWVGGDLNEEYMTFVAFAEESSESLSPPPTGWRYPFDDEIVGGMCFTPIDDEEDGAESQATKGEEGDPTHQALSEAEASGEDGPSAKRSRSRQWARAREWHHTEGRRRKLELAPPRESAGAASHMDTSGGWWQDTPEASWDDNRDGWHDRRTEDGDAAWREGRDSTWRAAPWSGGGDHKSKVKRGGWMTKCIALSTMVVEEQWDEAMHTARKYLVKDNADEL